MLEDSCYQRRLEASSVVISSGTSGLAKKYLGPPAGVPLANQRLDGSKIEAARNHKLDAVFVEIDDLSPGRDRRKSANRHAALGGYLVQAALKTLTSSVVFRVRRQ